MMNFREMTRRLEQVYHRAEAQAVAMLLLEEGYGLTRADVLCGAVESLADGAGERLEADVRRLESGEPVQYVLRRAEFCGRSFCVEHGVLIPRPETEELCRLVVSHLSRQGGAKTILDVGTGSGCIAVTLALDVAGSRVEACDVSPTALRVARENAERLGADVNVTRMDALALPGGDEERWSAVVSNPPYVCRREQAAMHRNVVDHEPHEALFVPDDDPLLFYRAITAYAAKALQKGGLLAFELNPLYADETAALARATGRFEETLVHADAYGKRRMMTAVRM